MNNFISKLPLILSSRVSIYIYIFLFFYLVIIGMACIFIPGLEALAPSDQIQLVLGNYTNVLSALGASIAATSGIVINKKIRSHRELNEKLETSISDLHDKLNEIQSYISRVESEIITELDSTLEEQPAAPASLLNDDIV